MVIRADARALPLRDACAQCVVTSPPYWGLRDYAVPGQLGLEPTPEAYVSAVVAVFREVRRVLKDDGTVWLNLGDSYFGPAGGYDPAYEKEGPEAGPRSFGGTKNCLISVNQRHKRAAPPKHPIIKTKDLVGIPWRVAFALQAAGWYLRSDIIWAKPNPMPESVTDRPTKAHEYVFLLAKSDRYYYDAAAIREAYAPSTLLEFERSYEGSARKDYAAAGAQDPSAVKARIVKKRAPRPGIDENGGNQGSGGIASDERGGANKRSVWTIPTHAYPGAHFATFPEALVEPCVLAGSRVGDLVLDPFLGSGTVGAVADRLLRRWVGTDLGFHDLARERTRQRGLRLLEEA